MSEKFALKWNDFQSHWSRSLSELQKDTDFADVTLISEDKVKFSAHRLLLSSCSNVFKFILKENNQVNPLLYLGGVSSINLGFILDYMYCGEVKLYQEQLDGFLESAKKLEIEGLEGENLNLDDFENMGGYHHLGGTSMGIDKSISVVNSKLQVPIESIVFWYLYGI